MRMVVSILLSILLSDYCCFISFSWINLDTQSHKTCHVHTVERGGIAHHDFLRIAQAGFIGCLFGCICIRWKLMRIIFTTLASCIRKGLMYRMRYGMLTCTNQHNPIYHHDTKYHKKLQLSESFLEVSLQVILDIIVVGIHILLAVFLSLQSLSCYTLQHTYYFHIPLVPVVWLMDFLIHKEDHLTYFTTSYSNLQMPRYYWLVYWGIFLFIALPPAIQLAQYISTRSTNHKRKLVVISRKYFHFMALLLFGPPTYYAPQMMSFSYAVAISLLLMIEFIRYRTDNLQETIPYSNNKKKMEPCKDTIAIPSSVLYAMNNFYNAFLGDHDTSNGFVATHLLLIFGCAFPLWFYQVFSSQVHCEPILPYIGIIILGIGDSFGAVCGVLFGNLHWPGSKRTVEGSISMLFTTQITVTIVNNILDQPTSFDEFFYILAPISMVEASTSQIDNLYLPLMTTCLWLLREVDSGRSI